MVDMEVCTAVAEPDYRHVEDSTDVFYEKKLKELISQGSLHFDDWTYLVSEIENSFPDDIEKLCLVYDSFLSEYPLCHGYWRKYAYHKIRLCTVDKVVEVFERAVQEATYCVAVWVDYCSFGISAFEDPNDVRRLFERGISFVGKDYLCHNLWDKYIEFELAHRQWSSLAHLYLQTLRFPSKKLHHYYESFRRLAASLEEEIECKIDTNGVIVSEPVIENTVPARYTDDEISHVMRDLLDPSIGLTAVTALQKYLSIGEQFYQDAHRLAGKIHCFETHIRRPYFHVKPLDASQLEIWHRYLDFAETYGDFDWAVKLYERCLIPCSSYPEFWMRYVDFVESKGGREIANFALSRAAQVFLKNAYVIHLFSARFKEQIGDVSAACDAFSHYAMESDSSFVENVIIKANMEKRLGKFEAAATTYKEALENIAASKENLQTLPMLYFHFSHLKYVMTNNADAAGEILIDGIKKVPRCKLLLKELIKFTMMHGGSQRVDLIDSIIAKEISPGPDSSHGLREKDMEEISTLYIQFVDLCGTIHDVRKAWNRHIKLFPHTVRLNSHQHPVTSEKPLEGFIHRRQETLAGLSHKPSRDNGVDNSVVSPLEDGKASPAGNNGTQSNYGSTNHVSEKGLQMMENQVAEEVSKSSPEFCKENVMHQENRHNSEEDLKQLSLEKLSLNPHKDEAPREIGTSSQSKPKDVPVTKRAQFMTNPLGARDSDAIEIQPSGITHSPPSSPSHQSIHVEALKEQESARHGGRNWHYRNNSDQTHRDSKPGSHKKHRLRHVSQRQNYSPGEASQGILGQNQALVPENSQAQQHQNPTIAPYANQVAPAAWSMQNVQQQSSYSTPQSQSQFQFQPSVANTQAQILQNHVQYTNQQGQMQNDEAYNQMWQYYNNNYCYYNQQQELSQQTQSNQNSQHQLNQNPQQHLFLEQYQQQLLQLHQYFQQQQSQQQIESQQSQNQPLEQQQNGQKVELQEQLLQQQQQQQQLLVQQPYPQQQQLSYEQQQQFLQQQYPFNLQYQQQQQQQQWPLEPQPWENEEKKKEQKSCTPQIETQHSNLREGQEFKPAGTAASEGDVSVVSPH